VIRRAVGRVIGFLRSTGFAIALLAFTGVWSMVATFVPQGDAYEPGVMAWTTAHPVAEKITGFLGLHQAFTAPVFRVAVVALALSTGLCAWRRTSVARARARRYEEPLWRVPKTLSPTTILRSPAVLH